MPVLDMSLKELKKYKGISPLPKDFDAYWERGLKEVRALDSQLDLTPSSFESPIADCFDLRFSGIDGSRVYARYLRPKDNSVPHPTIFFWHGYTNSSKDWVTYLPYVASGFCVVAMDCRGQGGKSEDLGGVPGNTLEGHITRGLDGGAEKLIFRRVFLDTAQLIGLVSQFDEVDENRLASAGASQGGALALVAAALSPQIKLVYSQYPFLSDFRRVWEMDLAVYAYEDLRTYFRRFDPRHERVEEIFHDLGYIDIQNLAKRIKGDVLMVTGLMDSVCPPSTQFAAYNKIKAKKEMIIYPDYAHEDYPDSHDIMYRFLLPLR